VSGALCYGIGLSARQRKFGGELRDPSPTLPGGTGVSPVNDGQDARPTERELPPVDGGIRGGHVGTTDLKHPGIWSRGRTRHRICVIVYKMRETWTSSW